MEFTDYYKVLGVEPTADEKTIKSAYRRLARQYHPDVNKEKGAEDRFKEVAEAYDVLKDPEKRTQFDQLRQYVQSGGDFEPSPGWKGGASFQGDGADGRGFSEFFESIFGNRNGRSGFGGTGFQRSGQDVEMELPVFLEEVLAGDVKSVSYQLPQYGDKGRRPMETKTLSVRIPKGVSDGERIRLKGQGGKGVGGAPNGDLYLVIRFSPHPLFEVDGHNLILTVPVAPWEAALGAKVAIPTLGGQIAMTIPANAQAGQRFRVKGKGLPTRTGESGDLLAVLQVAMPATSSEEAQRLWRQLADKSAFDPRAQWSKK